MRQVTLFVLRGPNTFTECLPTLYIARYLGLADLGVCGPLTAGRLGQTVETPQQRGLARARGTEQDERATALHPDRHVFGDGGRRLPAGSIIGEQELVNLEERIAQ
jgi:hypothetical protein